MEFIWTTGIAMIAWLQGLGGWLEAPMKFFTYLGSEDFFMVALPFVYWCVDAGSGVRIGAILLFTGGVNDILKLSFHGPRPYWISTQIKSLAVETSFGIPSGHAQIATGLWGMAAAQTRRKWAWLVAILLIFMIGISRLYLAVHFPHDVLLGWAIGVLVLWAFMRWWEPVAAWANEKSLGQQIGLAFTLSIVMLVSGLLAFGSLRGWILPAEWVETAMRAWPDIKPDPITLEGTITPAATLFGMLAGLAWSNSRGGFNASGSLWKRLARLLPGLVGILIINLGLKYVFASFSEGNILLSYFLRYVRYAFVGFWVSGGGPWIFEKLKLTQNNKAMSHDGV